MQRPTGVTILGVLAFIGAALLVIAAGGTFLVGGAILSRMAGRPMAMIGGAGLAFVALVFLGLAVLYVILGSGLMKLRNWARVVTIVLVALGILTNGLALLNSLMHMRPVFSFYHAIFTAIDVWIVVYLLKPEIKQAFGATGF